MLQLHLHLLIEQYSVNSKLFSICLIITTLVHLGKQHCTY